MTEIDTAPEGAEFEKPETPDADWFLQKLVSLVNSFDMSFGITLHVGGLTVTGRLIGGREYFEMFAKEISEGFFRDAQGDLTETRQGIKDSFTSMGQLYPKDEPSDDAERVRCDFPGYIHLEDAHFWLGTAFVPSNRGTLWRGRIGEVDGFVLGELNSD